jgi:hypothetical protein
MDAADSDGLIAWVRDRYGTLTRPGPPDPPHPPDVPRNLQ